jgi:hypothetical protein
MTIHYMDPSAWIKRHFQEAGSDSVNALFRLRFEPACCRLGLIEMLATVARKSLQVSLDQPASTRSSITFNPTSPDLSSYFRTNRSSIQPLHSLSAIDCERWTQFTLRVRFRFGKTKLWKWFPLTSSYSLLRREKDSPPSIQPLSPDFRLTTPAKAAADPQSPA